MSTPRWLAEDRGLAAEGWRHGWTTAAGPDFRAGPGTPAMKAAMAALGRGTRLPALSWVHQVHGGTVLRARGPGLVGDADDHRRVLHRAAVEQVGRHAVAGIDGPLHQRGVTPVDALLGAQSPSLWQ